MNGYVRQDLQAAKKAFAQLKKLNEARQPGTNVDQHKISVNEPFPFGLNIDAIGYIVTLIAHQTRLRAAWDIDPAQSTLRDVVEIFPLTDGGPVFPEDPNYLQLVCNGIASTLGRTENGGCDFPYRDYLADGLTVLAACLQSRHSEGIDDKLNKLRWPLSQWQETLRASVGTADKPTTCLMFLEYGRSLHRGVMKGETASANWTEFVRRAAALGDSKENLWVVLPNLRSDHFWRLAAADESLFRLIQGAIRAPNMSDSVVAAELNQVAGNCKAVRPSDGQMICWQLGNDMRIYADELDAYLLQGNENKAKAAFEFILRRENTFLETGKHNFTVARVLHILGVINSVVPFPAELRITPLNMPRLRQPVPTLRSPITIPLWDSKIFVDPERRLDSYNPNDITRPETVLIRAAAAIINNFAVTLSPHEVRLEFVWLRSDREPLCDLRRNWEAFILRRMKECGASAIEAYVSEYRYRTTILGRSHIELTTLPANPSKWVILGLDVGGTSIGGAIYDIAPAQDNPHGVIIVERPQSQFKFDTPLAEGSGKYDGATGFANIVLESVVSALEKQGIESSLLEVNAIGLAWPGPVQNNRWAAAASGVFQHFVGLSRLIGRNDPRVTRETLELSTAFENAYEVLCEKAFGKKNHRTGCFVLNDGEADILGRFWQQGSANYLKAILKLGTGVAFALQYKGVTVDILGEIGKATLNLNAELHAGQSFPPGVLTDYLRAGAISRDVDDRRAPVLMQLLKAGGVKPGEAMAALLVHAALIATNQEASMKLVNKYISGLEEKSKFTKQTVNSDRIRTSLRKIINIHADSLVEEAGEMIKRYASMATDAIVALVQLFRCVEVELCGGPMQGAFGEMLYNFCREGLQERFGIEVASDEELPQDAPHALTVQGTNRIRLLQPSPSTTSSDASKSHGALGAALSAYERFSESHCRAR